MSSEINSPTSSLTVQVTLDGQPVELEGEDLRLVAAMRGLMERVAGQRQRKLVRMSVEGVAVTLVEGVPPTTAGLPMVEATSPHVAEPCVSALRLRLPLACQRLEEVALLATINEWPAVERLWWEVLPDLRGTVLSLSWLGEFYGARLATPVVEGRTLAAHLETLAETLKQVSDCLAHEDAMAFSDMLDQKLVPWLRKLELFLTKLA